MESFERLQMVPDEDGPENLSYPPQQPQSSRKKKNKTRNKKRFTDEQIKSLESIFESETKLEPRKKLQLARELGLQPRQVAIWFQNKRARWKSKQIEHEYRELRTSYENLSSQFESLKKEKLSLLIQVEKLNGLLGKQNKDCISSPRSNSWDKEHDMEKPEAVSSCLQMESEKEQLEVVENGGGCSAAQTQAVHEEWGFPSSGEFQAGPSALPQKTYGYDSGGFFEQTCGMSHWLNFWT